MSIFAFARVVAKPDRTEALRSAAIDIVSPSRNEDGCLSYDLFNVVGEPDELRFYSEWRDEAAFTAHGSTPHVREWLEVVERDATGAVEIATASKAV